jgi:hypothetical protein
MTQSYRLSFLVLTAGLGLASAVLSACGDKTALQPHHGSGGSSAVVPGAGGDVQGSVPSSVGGNSGYSEIGTGGAIVGTGGAIVGTGGAVVGTGGAIVGTGGAAVGGAIVGAGGAGGVSFGVGGANMGTGGARIATGGIDGGSTLGSGGSGGAILGGCRYPSCLWNLVKDCLVIGQCTEESNPSSTIQQKLCCDNGVDETVSVLTQSSSVLSGTVAVTKSGAACYTVSFSGRVTSGSEMNVTYAWIDPSGEIAAKGVMTNSKFVTLTCPNGETEQFPVDCSPDGSDQAIRTPGRCE